MAALWQRRGNPGAMSHEPHRPVTAAPSNSGRCGDTKCITSDNRPPTGARSYKSPELRQNRRSSDKTGGLGFRAVNAYISIPHFTTRPVSSSRKIRSVFYFLRRNSPEKLTRETNQRNQPGNSRQPPAVSAIAGKRSRRRFARVVCRQPRPFPETAQRRQALPAIRGTKTG